jgi:hypothetical protein
MSEGAAQKLIEEVLAPFDDSELGMGEYMERCADAAPKLARMLKVAITSLKKINPEYAYVTASQMEIAEQALAELDRIAEGGGE